MNQTKLKAYAPQARREFIQAVTDRAAFYGLRQDGTSVVVVPMVEKGDGVVVGGNVFPKKVAEQRKALEDRVRDHGFAQTMDAVAYTWFNRLIAIRYMEIHGYLEHGYRVLSHPEGHARPEILDHAADVDLPGLDREKAIQLKLDGTQDEVLYRILLLAQCNALHYAMPFLFEEIGDETELLLPANLLHTDSLVRKLVESTDDADWEQIEIIGWLYQFYISEKKDEVIGKVVKPEDIPAATQLFTPNWIVKYIVQNSLGALWLATYPQSSLKGQMDYYVEPAEQTDEVKAQLAAITPRALNPEELTLIDPASGSGHILVEAYELFKAIYLERGYRPQEVAQLILEKNLFGVDIDERAAQLTGFALMMKGRADDRRLFERDVKLNVLALQNTTGFDAKRLAQGITVTDYELQLGDLTELERLFEHATAFGSLIQVPEELAAKLPALKQLCQATSHDLFASQAFKRLRRFVQQADLLAARYDVVAANPPYMGSNGMDTLVKKFAKDHFPDAKSDLFACFIERGYPLAKDLGRIAMVTMQSWMFLSSFEIMRERLLREKTISTMTQIGYNSFPLMNSKVAQATVFSLINYATRGYLGAFINLNSAPQSADKRAVFLSRDPANRFEVSADDFKKIPGSPIAYWVDSVTWDCFAAGVPISSLTKIREGINTGDNARFLRAWSEVSFDTICFGAKKGEHFAASWAPHNKGGPFRRWYGNLYYVMNWREDGLDIHEFHGLPLTYNGAPVRGKSHFFEAALSWSRISSGRFALRLYDEGLTFDSTAPSIFCSKDMRNRVAGFLNSNVVDHLLGTMSPTLDYRITSLGRLPFITSRLADSGGQVDECIAFERSDWNAYERSWEFQSFPLLTAATEPASTLESSYKAWIAQNCVTIAEMKRLEGENNRFFTLAYGLAHELAAAFPIDQVTLTVNPAYRYDDSLSEEEQWTRFRQDTMQELVSYAVGCMMGRYSLDAPGLIYAHSGNEGFDPRRYARFRADQDGILPLTDKERFDDDACGRLVEFISVAWDAAYLEDNLTFLAESLSPRKNEASRETLRRYLCESFFKDHLQTYKKRPIYWLFSSGKQRAFQCLVYLHRYNEGTLARMRTEYVVPLQGQISSRIEQLEGDKAKANSTSHRKKLEKEQDLLKKQRTELLAFEEKLKHTADKKIRLDLDDGVKVNYGKFGDLLAAVDAVTGGDDE